MRHEIEPAVASEIGEATDHLDAGCVIPAQRVADTDDQHRARHELSAE
jgi:hypothetical protein